MRRDAQDELGPQSAEAMPPVPRAAPQPLDPGAERLVESMLARLGDRQRGEDGVTRIGVTQIRNLSRAHSKEFDHFTERFADALSRAGRTAHVLFVAGDGNGVALQYELHGSAYLISADGLDQWELFLSLSPAGRPLTLWQPERPVRVLRRPRPGQPQIMPGF